MNEVIRFLKTQKTRAKELGQIMCGNFMKRFAGQPSSISKGPSSGRLIGGALSGVK